VIGLGTPDGDEVPLGDQSVGEEVTYDSLRRQLSEAEAEVEEVSGRLDASEWLASRVAAQEVEIAGAEAEPCSLQAEVPTAGSQQARPLPRACSSGPFRRPPNRARTTRNPR